ncbi:putative diguanylate cyclase YdaM [Fervidicola ferrireducens]|uniref:Stage 0 sporulation protein A homolog n=1 Tax=Fervidicola ferrireducens TaxID=520764 RepID=A0A140L863_9FIRM|nr:diguanylate cyclase [Fervidicola ferrireducens]KXG76738.1 putative diguanylate cyclase YdaM [Fervidicola ferrireducens]
MNDVEPKKILIVEDSRLNARITADILIKYGYDVETVRTGEEAVEKVKSEQNLDLILMDIELMGKLDGIETARLIQQYKDIPVIFLTANANKEIMEKIKSVTGYGYMLKGVDEYVLISTVEMALKLHETNTTLKQRERMFQFYHHLFENSPNEIYIFHSETFKLISANRRARENLGYSLEELKEMTFFDLKPEIDIQSFKELLAPLYEGKREFIIFNTTQRRKDGSTYPVELHLLLLEFAEEKVYMAIVIDVTERKTLERELQERNEILSAIMKSARDAIIMIDDKGDVTFWNPAAEQVFGYTKEEVMGKELHRFMIHDESLYQRYKEAFKKFQSSGKGSAVGKTIELKTKHKDGHEIYVELSLSAVKIKDSWHAIGILRDITERKKIEEMIYLQSITDPLTNIYNRRFFMQMMEQEMERTRRNGKPFSLIMFDIDHFKSVNDRFGHAAGDMVLKSIADTVKNRIRKTDCFARWGGEEFIILLPETSLKDAAGLAEELREKLSNMTLPEVGHITASFGVASFRPSDTIDTILLRADDMLYEAKAAGRNCVKIEK